MRFVRDLWRFYRLSWKLANQASQSMWTSDTIRPLHRPEESIRTLSIWMDSTSLNCWRYRMVRRRRARRMRLKRHQSNNKDQCSQKMTKRRRKISRPKKWRNIGNPNSKRKARSRNNRMKQRTRRKNTLSNPSNLKSKEKWRRLKVVCLRKPKKSRNSNLDFHYLN